MSDLLIFDFDGTLADTGRDIATALNRTLGEVGLPAAELVQVRQWVGDGVRRLVERALPEAERTPARVAALTARFGEHYDRCCLDTTALYPGIAECLARLADHTLAVLSNKPARFLDRLIAALGLAGRFAAVLGGDSVAVPKPDPAAVAQVVRAVGTAPRTLWVIGDSAVDVKTGRAAAAHTIGCAWGFRGAAELRAAGAEFIVQRPAEIPPLVGGGT